MLHILVFFSRAIKHTLYNISLHKILDVKFGLNALSNKTGSGGGFIFHKLCINSNNETSAMRWHPGMMRQPRDENTDMTEG